MEPIHAASQSRLMLRLVQITLFAYAALIAASTVLSIAGGSV
jgi:hypothetical protein